MTRIPRLFQLLRGEMQIDAAGLGEAQIVFQMRGVRITVQNDWRF